VTDACQLAREERGPAPRCRTVALIGPDGCGKTSVARLLLQTSRVSMKYLYMGLSIDSSNAALPTSRLVHWWKVRQHKRSLRASGREVPD
jgi:hypothetical protein